MAARSRRKRRTVELKLRLYSGQDDELIRWLEQFDDQPYGTKSQAVKEALERGSGSGSSVTAPALDLAEIRQVVEVAVTQALARFEGQPTAIAVLAEEDDEAEALLDNLGAALVLADE